MNDREYALDRARKVLASGNRPYIACPDFIKYTKGVIEAVYCRCCGCEIKHWIETEQPLKVHRQNGTSTITKMVVLAQLDNYKEFTMEFDDGSAHVAHICSKCYKGLDENIVRCMYAAELLMLDKECSMVKIRDFPWNLWAYRRVVRWKDEVN